MSRCNISYLPLLCVFSLTNSWQRSTGRVVRKRISTDLHKGWAKQISDGYIIRENRFIKSSRWILISVLYVQYFRERYAFLNITLLDLKILPVIYVHKCWIIPPEPHITHHSSLLLNLVKKFVTIRSYCGYKATQYIDPFKGSSILISQ